MSKYVNSLEEVDTDLFEKEVKDIASAMSLTEAVATLLPTGQLGGMVRDIQRIDLIFARSYDRACCDLAGYDRQVAARQRLLDELLPLI